MPTYEYACSTCATNHEVVQPITDATLTNCPVCGDPGLRKLFSNVGVVFKGSGFYRTDSRDKKSDSATGTAKSGDSKSGETKSGDSKSGETKSGDSKSGESKSSEPAKKSEATPKSSAPTSSAPKSSTPAST